MMRHLLVFVFTSCLTAVANGDLLVGSSNTHAIMRYHEETGNFLGFFVTPGSGGLDTPQAFTFGPDGDFYVSSHGTDSVKKYDGLTGTYITDFVTTGSGGLDGPVGLVFGPDRNDDGIVDLYVVSNLTVEVLVYDGATGIFLGVFASGNGMNGTDGLIFSSDGNYLYVISNGSHEVMRFDGASGAPDPVGPFATGTLDFPQDPAFGPDYNLYVANHHGHSVVRFSGRTGAYIDDFVPSGSGGLSKTQGLAFGPDRNGDHWPELYASSENTDSVKVYDGQTGKYMGDFVAPGSGGLDLPNFLMFAEIIPCHADLNGDGVVDFFDLVLLLGAWVAGGCP